MGIFVVLMVIFSKMTLVGDMLFKKKLLFIYLIFFSIGKFTHTHLVNFESTKLPFTHSNLGGGAI